ncbi:hypothetical protein PAL_GLEAN10002640 [Pteropus alecto]|uniref:Uncharacterized protein n=1 Tax=Pteropus alecto TaxID=9402 RepID=L5KCY0_PTEAL|nr:hypothetical protein PAL_GLEAN10002640 [Pteropus alecto]
MTVRATVSSRARASRSSLGCGVSDGQDGPEWGHRPAAHGCISLEAARLTVAQRPVLSLPLSRGHDDRGPLLPVALESRVCLHWPPLGILVHLQRL